MIRHTCQRDLPNDCQACARIPEQFVAERKRRVRCYRNTRSVFLFGASWSHFGEWKERTIHVYLGPWLVTITVPSRVRHIDGDRRG